MAYRSCQMVYHSEPLSEYAEEVFKWPVGHFAFSEQSADGTFDMYMVLPTDESDGRICIIPVRLGPKQQNAWQWDGNREKPTLTPSIWHHSTPDWHGWVTRGEMIGCA